MRRSKCERCPGLLICQVNKYVQVHYRMPLTVSLQNGCGTGRYGPVIRSRVRRLQSRGGESQWARRESRLAAVGTARQLQHRGAVCLKGCSLVYRLGALFLGRRRSVVCLLSVAHHRPAVPRLVVVVFQLGGFLVGREHPVAHADR